MMFKKSLFKLTVAVGAALSSLPGHAIPAWPGLRTHVQPDGSSVDYYVRGDEHRHFSVTPAGALLRFSGDTLCYAKAMADGTVRSTGIPARNADPRQREYVVDLQTLPRNKAPQRVLDLDGFPTVGNMRGLVILVNYADTKMQPEHTADVFSRIMNEQGCTLHGSTGSARDYFTDQSMGLFTPTFDVVGPVELDHGYAFYGQNNRYGEDVGGGNMVREACMKADEDFGVDFSLYDYDDNGEVDFVYVYYAGYAESYGASPNTIWPHASQLDAQYLELTVDGKKVNRYACSSELKFISGNTLEGIGTFCHEFGHVLGLPDLYNTFSAMSPQLGSWDIMDQGSYNNQSHTPPAYSAFERYSIGWLEFVELDEPAYDVELPEITESNFAYIITTDDPDEYFTLENRQGKGWDAHLPGTGLMIEHIHFDRNSWVTNTVNSGMYPRVDLVEADGTQGTGEASDLFPGTGGVMMFTDYTPVAMVTHSGKPVYKGISNIAEIDGMVKFNFMHDRLAVPEALSIVETNPTSAVIEWSPTENAIGYALNVSEVIPEEERTLLFEETFSGFAEGEYPKSDYLDVSGEMDSFTTMPGWRATDVYQTGGEIRVGSYGKSGSITTPAIATQGAERLTVALSGHSYTGKRVDFTVTLSDLDGNTLMTEKFNTNKDLKDFVLLADCSADEVQITVATDNERLFVNALRVLKGDIADDELWTAGKYEFEIEDIEVCRFTVDNLRPSRTYLVKVRSVAGPGLAGSWWSDEVTFTTADEASLPSMSLTDPDLIVPTKEGFTLRQDLPGVTLTVYNMQGIKIAHLADCRAGFHPLPAEGIYLLTLSDGQSMKFYTK